jgi:hypothetical protein
MSKGGSGPSTILSIIASAKEEAKAEALLNPQLATAKPRPIKVRQGFASPGKVTQASTKNHSASLASKPSPFESYVIYVVKPAKNCSVRNSPIPTPAWVPRGDLGNQKEAQGGFGTLPEKVHGEAPGEPSGEPWGAIRGGFPLAPHPTRNRNRNLSAAPASQSSHRALTIKGLSVFDAKSSSRNVGKYKEMSRYVWK